MKRLLLALSGLALTTTLATSAAADVPPPNDCTTPGQACDNAPPDYKSPGVCTKTTCQKAYPPPDGSIVDCNLCLPSDGGTGTGGAAGGGAAGSPGTGGSGTGGAGTAGGSSSGSSDDGSCSVSSVPRGGTTAALLLAAVAALGFGRRKR